MLLQVHFLWWYSWFWLSPSWFEIFFLVFIVYIFFLVLICFVIFFLSWFSFSSWFPSWFSFVPDFLLGYHFHPGFPFHFGFRLLISFFHSPDLLCHFFSLLVFISFLVFFLVSFVPDFPPASHFHAGFHFCFGFCLLISFFLFSWFPLFFFFFLLVFIFLLLFLYPDFLSFFPPETLRFILNILTIPVDHFQGLPSSSISLAHCTPSQPGFPQFKDKLCLDLPGPAWIYVQIQVKILIFLQRYFEASLIFRFGSVACCPDSLVDSVFGCSFRLIYAILTILNLPEIVQYPTPVSWIIVRKNFSIFVTSADWVAVPPMRGS